MFEVSYWVESTCEEISRPGRRPGTVRPVAGRGPARISDSHEGTHLCWDEPPSLIIEMSYLISWYFRHRNKQMRIKKYELKKYVHHVKTLKLKNLSGTNIWILIAWHLTVEIVDIHRNFSVTLQIKHF